MKKSMTESKDERVKLEKLCAANLAIFKDLLGRTEFGGCFCAVWTSHDETWGERCADPSHPNFKITESRVRAGHEVGYLVFLGSDLIGWTGSGPKSHFPLLEKKLGSRLSPSGDGVWAIGCIALKEGFRGRGFSDRIVEAVIGEARKSGGKVIEAYPTRPWDESRSFRGSEAVYLRIGFKEICKEPDGGSEIILMQYDLVGG